MMYEREEQMRAKVLRRCRSDRGSLFLEFALIAPLMMSVMFFALDFTRICRAEQQLEIAARVLADVGAHSSNPKFPQRRGKAMVRRYLADTLGVNTKNGVYCIGERYPVPGMASLLARFDPATWLQPSDVDGFFVRFLKSLVRGLVNLITFGTHPYLLDPIRADRGVKASVSVRLKSYLPGNVYAFYGANYSKDGVLLVQQQPELDGGGLDDRRRTRYYCHMPVLDTGPEAPATYVRIVRDFIDNLIKKLKFWE